MHIRQLKLLDAQRKPPLSTETLHVKQNEVAHAIDKCTHA